MVSSGRSWEILTRAGKKKVTMSEFLKTFLMIPLDLRIWSTRSKHLQNLHIKLWGQFGISILQYLYTCIADTAYLTVLSIFEAAQLWRIETLFIRLGALKVCFKTLIMFKRPILRSCAAWDSLNIATLLIATQCCVNMLKTVRSDANIR